MRFSLQPRTASIELSEQMHGSIAESPDRPSVNRDAFRDFYSRTHGPLWAYLMRISGHRDVADDLLQESYCRFLAAKLPEMDAAESRSYLFRIATNLLRDRWRRREVPDAINTTGQSCVDDPEMRTDVRRAFEQLKLRERQLLWLAHVEGFDHREIARLTGLKLASVRVLLFRARAELAGALRERSRNGKRSVDL
jgi:RNA polymerase sigma-70 factor (ECF subfamily)